MPLLKIKLTNFDIGIVGPETGL